MQVRIPGIPYCARCEFQFSLGYLFTIYCLFVDSSEEATEWQEFISRYCVPQAIHAKASLTDLSTVFGIQSGELRFRKSSFLRF